MEDCTIEKKSDPQLIDGTEDNFTHTFLRNSQTESELENGDFDQLTSINSRSIGVDTQSLRVSSSVYTQSGPTGPYRSSQVYELIGPAPQRTNGIYINIDKTLTSAFVVNMTLKMYVVAGADALEWELTCCREKESNEYVATVKSKNSDDHGVTVQVGPFERIGEFDGQKTVKNFSIYLPELTYSYGVPFYTLDSVASIQDINIGLTRKQRAN